MTVSWHLLHLVEFGVLGLGFKGLKGLRFGELRLKKRRGTVSWPLVRLVEFRV